MKNTILEYFLKYVKIDTMSMEDQNKVPSTDKQFNLAKVLVKDLEELGLEDIKLTEHCFVTAVLKSNCNSNLHIGFVAHMDTIPGFSGTNVNPQIVNNYDGKVIKLKGIELNPKQFPFLNDLVGKTLITTDGTTVLGADDKAGVADIMAMLNYYVNNPNQPHVNIHVAFTPDEEIGGGIDYMDVKGFGCDFAYTVDGLHYDEIEYENFNASSALVEVSGLDIHPGSAKGQMKNAARIAMEFDSLLPEFERPEYTDGYEGFNHLCEISGEVGSAKLVYILRNHDKNKLLKQQNDFMNTEAFLNNKYGKGTVKVTIKHSYSNMRELIEKDDRCVKRAEVAMRSLGIEPVSNPIRGGTDGAKLTLMGLNTPNIGTGGYNCHGPYEMACLEEMELVVKTLIEIAKEQ
ncbi:MAG: peptidase T [Acholeplasmatales bacterium]|nr:peptidase T [Acholeplasmatales bacterium]